MSSRPVSSRVIGVLSIAYGALQGLFWAWVYWGQGKTEIRGTEVLLMALFVAAPILLIAAGCGLCFRRVAEPDARALKAATVAVLVVKAAVTGYWAIGLIAATGAFSGLLHPVGWRT